MSTSAKSPPEGLKESKCERGNIFNWRLIPYVQPADLNKKQEKMEIKIKIPDDGTNYQRVPFCSGNNKDYVTHIIAMHCLLEQKESEENVAKASKMVEELNDNKLKPLAIAKCLNMSKFNVEKEELKLQTTSVKEEIKSPGKRP